MCLLLIYCIKCSQLGTEVLVYKPENMLGKAKGVKGKQSDSSVQSCTAQFNVFPAYRAHHQPSTRRTLNGAVGKTQGVINSGQIIITYSVSWAIRNSCLVNQTSEK